MSLAGTKCSGSSCLRTLNTSQAHSFCCNQQEVYCHACAQSCNCRTCGNSILNSRQLVACSQCGSSSDLYHCGCQLICWICLFDPYQPQRICQLCLSAYEPYRQDHSTAHPACHSLQVDTPYANSQHTKKYRVLTTEKCSKCLRQYRSHDVFRNRCGHVICKQCLASPQLELICYIRNCHAKISKDDLWEYRQAQKRRRMEQQQSTFPNQPLRGRKSQASLRRSSLMKLIKQERDQEYPQQCSRSVNRSCSVAKSRSILGQDLLNISSQKDIAREAVIEIMMLKEENARLHRLIEAVKNEKDDIERQLDVCKAEQQQMNEEIEQLRASLDRCRHSKAEHKQRYQRQVRQLQEDFEQIRALATSRSASSREVKPKRKATTFDTHEDGRYDVREATCQTQELLAQIRTCTQNESLREQVELLREQLHLVQQSVQKIERQDSHPRSSLRRNLMLDPPFH